jgi:hypothetical protein
MTARTCSNKLSAGRPEHRRKLTRLFAILPWLMVALLLTGCVGNIISPIPPPPGAPPGPPSHDNAWLSYKVSRSCGPIASCAGLLDFDDSNGLSEASKYYCSIGVDPTACAAGKPPTYSFSQWKTDNGFPATGFPPAHAFYFNKGDLQLGRDMNCVQNGPTGQNVACYVSNYGPPPFDVNTKKENILWPAPDAAIDAAIHQTPPNDPSGNGLFATVAMIFNPNGVGPNGDTVTFYVFNAAGNLVNNAALDGEGGKSVPRMCMACHGGAYTQNTATGFPYNSKAPGINFLPFDVWFFHYKTDDPSNSLGNPDLQEGFRQLNLLIKITHTSQQPTKSDTAIVESIDDQYNEPGQCGGINQPPCGVENPGSQVPVDPQPPTGWRGNSNLYRTVFRPYCRMCHLGQGSGISRDLTFADSTTLPPSSVRSFVCGFHDMPHAEVPLGGQSGSNINTGLWWDVQAIGDLNAFLNSQPVCQ